MPFPRHPRPASRRARADRLRSTLYHAPAPADDTGPRLLADPEPRAEGNWLDGSHPRANYSAWKAGTYSGGHRRRDARSTPAAGWPVDAATTPFTGAHRLGCAGTPATRAPRTGAHPGSGSAQQPPQTGGSGARADPAGTGPHSRRAAASRKALGAGYHERQHQP